MTPSAAREALHRAAITLPDAAVVLVARLLALGVPGTDEVLGPAHVTVEPGDAPGETALRPGVGEDARVVAAELWRLLAPRRSR